MKRHINREDIVFLYRNRYVWKCYSVKAMKKLYPENKRNCIGEVISKRGENSSVKLKSEIDQSILYVQPLQTYDRLLYRTYAYLWSDIHNGFVLIKKRNTDRILMGIISAICIALFTAWGSLQILDSAGMDHDAKHFESATRVFENTDRCTGENLGYGNWNMDAVGSEVRVSLRNPSQSFYEFEIIYDASGESLYHSALVPPETVISSFPLPQSFRKGIYSVTVLIKSYALDDPTQLLHMGEVKTKIVVS